MQLPIHTSLGPTTSEQLAALQTAWDAQLFPHPGERLEPMLYNAARGHGEQVAFVSDGRRLIGCAAWVLIGVAQDGCAYGAPVIILEESGAGPLLDTVCAATRAAGASRLRISARPAELAKRTALESRGFKAIFDFVTFSLALPARFDVALPDGLLPVAFADLDWPKLYALYAECFKATPNSPLPTFELFMSDWGDLNRDASLVLRTRDGAYVAFCFIQDDTVESVGVADAMRGRRIAAYLYHHAAAGLHAQGAGMLSALVASTNEASMRLHQKTGFTERVPRRAVYELTL